MYEIPTSVFGGAGVWQEVIGNMSSMWFMSQLVEEKRNFLELYLQQLCKFEKFFSNEKKVIFKKYGTVQTEDF